MPATLGILLCRILKQKLGKNHDVIVISPNTKYLRIPSNNIEVCIDQLTTKQVTFELAPVYKKLGIDYKHPKATALFPEGSAENQKSYVVIEYTFRDKTGQPDKIEYDYLVNATGPRLNFGAT